LDDIEAITRNHVTRNIIIDDPGLTTAGSIAAIVPLEFNTDVGRCGILVERDEVN
jgi:hypothetical protein